MKFTILATLLFASTTAFSPAFFSTPTSSVALDARKPFIAGNWKMNPQTKDDAVALAMR